MRVDGDALRFRVPHRGRSLRYPLVVDPVMENAWSSYPGWVYEEREAAPWCCFFEPARDSGWGTGLYVINGLHYGAPDTIHFGEWFGYFRNGDFGGWRMVTAPEAYIGSAYFQDLRFQPPNPAHNGQCVSIAISLWDTADSPGWTGCNAAFSGYYIWQHAQHAYDGN